MNRLIRAKCATDELTEKLENMLTTWFAEDWLSIIKKLENGQIKSQEDIRMIFDQNW